MLIVIFQACAHTFFDELREPGTKLPHMRDLPPLFNFTQSELKIQPALNSQLIPAHMAAQVAAQAAAGTAGMHTIIALPPSHLSKHKSDLKQKCTQLLTPYSGTVFHALSHGGIHFARSVGFENQLNRSF